MISTGESRILSAKGTASRAPSRGGTGLPGRDAFLGREADIREPLKDPAGYDLVTVGTPVWSWSLSTPVRAYLARRQQRLARPAGKARAAA